MRYATRVLSIAAAVVAAFAVPEMAFSGGMGGRVLFAEADQGGGGDTNIDLAVRQVTVTPIRAHAGDKVRVDVVIENKAEGMANSNAELLVNGKVADRQLFTWGFTTGERLHRMSFDWDTRGIAPGEYRIGAQVFVWEDTSPFDNRLDVRQPVVIVPAGGEFPGGGTAGGSATETDPRFVNHASGG